MILTIAAGVVGVKIASDIIKNTANYISTKAAEKNELNNIGNFIPDEPDEPDDYYESDDDSSCEEETSRDVNENTQRNCKCIGCHAHLSGITGDSVRCEYCDTIQTI